MTSLRLSRRELIAVGVHSGAVLALELILPRTARGAPRSERAESFEPNVWLTIDGASIVTITVAKTEMGQGVWTALPMIVAEELDADWSRVRVRRADAEPGNQYQNTGGSSSVPDSWDILRRAGAVARHMLVGAAAARWGVAPNECATSAGTVVHSPTGRTFAYGDLVADAARLPLPAETSVPLKRPEDYRIIGRAIRRLDAPAKVRGTAIFGMDVRVPGMKYAVVARCPTFGGTLQGFDGTRSSDVPGVRQILEVRPIGAPTHLRGGVAVVADSTWGALEGRRLLTVRWDRGPHAALSSAGIAASFRAAVAQPGKITKNEGDVERELARRPTFEATYEYPFLAHAAMEPGNCTAHVSGDRAEIWAPTQYPTRTLNTLARLLKVPADRIALHVTLVGGGFGRRINDDFVVEAALISKDAGVPVQVVWTRDDDMQHDFYRQAGIQQLRAALDDDGLPTAIVHRVIGPSTNAFYTPNHPRPETQELWGLDLPYRIGSHRIEYVQADTPVPIGWWRSVSVSQNQFCLEAFISELAHRAGRDPIEYRRAMLQHRPRLVGVLDAVAEMADWHAPPPQGRARGVAITATVAEVVEASLTPQGDVRVHRVSCAIDCGRIVNSGIVTAQAEGSIVWGLTGALMNAITIAGGAPVQRHFGDYPVMRMRDMPELRIRLIDSSERPEGIGEPCVVPVAPALAAAVSQLRGAPVRALPINRTPRGSASPPGSW